MAHSQAAEAGPSSGLAPTTTTTTPPALRNVLHVFAAHFHVRKGNQVLLLHPPPSDSPPSSVAADLEWKAIPNGSHALSRDWLLFEVSGPSSSGIMTDRVGLAAFKRRDLDRQAREGREQRGARLVAVGAIAACPSRTSASWRSCTLPHLDALSSMAQTLALDDPMAETASEQTADMLRAYYDAARFDPTCQTTGKYSLPPAPGFKHLPVSSYDADPLWRLPIIADALGPLLPTLLKRCLIPGHRLLLFSPTGGETEQAAALAMNLGEIAQAASCVGANAAGGAGDEERGRDPHASSSTDAGREAVGGVKPSMWIRGLVGLHDMSALESEAREREQHGSSTSTAAAAKGWIAWTTDKLFLEKPKLFDAVLDLSPLVREQRGRGGDDEADDGDDDGAKGLGSYFAARHRRVNAELPVLLSSTIDAKGKLKLVRQQATAREFATFRNVDQQAVLDAHRVRRRRRGRRGSSVGGSSGGAPDTMTAMPSSRNGLSRSATSSSSRDNSSVIRTALALLRYWLAGWWILPNRWRLNLQRSSFGYVPLSIRSDGGVRGSLMLLDEISTSDDEDEDESDAGEAATEHETTRSAATGTSLEAGSSAISVRSGGSRGEQGEIDDDDEGVDEEEDVDPILLATGAVGNSLRRRRASRASDLDDQNAPPRFGGGAQGGLAPGSSASSLKARSVRASGGAPSERSTLTTTTTTTPPGSHARLADALFASWSEWLTDLVEDVEEMLYRFCPAFSAGGEDDDGQGGDEGGPSTPPPSAASAALTLKGRDLAWAGLSASSDVDVALVRAMAAAYTPRPIVVDKGWAIARWFC